MKTVKTAVEAIEAAVKAIEAATEAAIATVVPVFSLSAYTGSKYM